MLRGVKYEKIQHDDSDFERKENFGSFTVLSTSLYLCGLWAPRGNGRRRGILRVLIELYPIVMMAAMAYSVIAHVVFIHYYWFEHVPRGSVALSTTLWVQQLASYATGYRILRVDR